jgi:hypothetical protein
MEQFFEQSNPSLPRRIVHWLDEAIIQFGNNGGGKSWASPRENHFGTVGHTHPASHDALKPETECNRLNGMNSHDRSDLSFLEGVLNAGQLIERIDESRNTNQ